MRIFDYYLTPIICSDVSRPDRLSSAEISSVVQAAGLQGTLQTFSNINDNRQKSTAVRKNRYVILPIDFEEAWKVSGGFVFALYECAS